MSSNKCIIPGPMNSNAFSDHKKKSSINNSDISSVEPNKTYAISDHISRLSYDWVVEPQDY